jgi:hypothetical protein
MTGNDIAIRDGNGVQPVLSQPARAFQGAADLDSWIGVVENIAAFAEQVCRTSFVPRAYRNDPASTTAAILTGRELGLPPMTSLRHVQVVEGMPSLSAEYKRARVLAAGHRLDITEHTTEACTVTGHRKGHEPVTVRFTMADAHRAGLVESQPGKGPRPYKTRPRRMLFARACTEVCDALFSDLTNGLPTAELLEGGEDMPGYAEEAPRERVTGQEIRDRAARRADTVTGEVITGDAPEGETPPAVASRDQVGAIQGHLKRLGYGDDERDGKLRAISRLTRRVITSSKELTPGEASDVITTLEGFTEPAELAAHLADLATADDPRDDDDTAGEVSSDGE